MSALSKDLQVWRAERDWQMQSARLYRTSARLRATRPSRPWLTAAPSSVLLAWAAQAVHKARLANYELIALRRLASERSRRLPAASLSVQSH
jgi:hypothetical protein